MKKGKETITTERSIKDVSVHEFDAFVIPGGYSPDHLRMNPDMVRFVREFVISGRTVAAVCHAPWMLMEHRASAASSAAERRRPLNQRRPLASVFSARASLRSALAVS